MSLTYKWWVGLYFTLIIIGKLKKCPFPFSFFRISGDLLFSQVPFHGNIWKGQVYLHLTDTWNSILAIPACQCTSFLLNPSEKSLSFTDLPKVHGAQVMCTLSNTYWKRPENSFLSGFSKDCPNSPDTCLKAKMQKALLCYQELELLLFLKKVRRIYSFLQFFLASEKPRPIWPIIALWNMYVM